MTERSPAPCISIRDHYGQSELPKTPSGKIQRFKLREEAAQDT